MKVRLRIERVVLDGLPVANRDRWQFERSLRETLGGAFLALAASLPDSDVRERRVVAASVHIGAAPDVAVLGERVGRSVHAAIGGVGRP